MKALTELWCALRWHHNWSNWRKVVRVNTDVPGMSGIHEDIPNPWGHYCMWCWRYEERLDISLSTAPR